MMIELRRLMHLGLLISEFVILSGCVQEKALTVPTEIPTEIPTVQPTTSTEIYCVSNEIGTKMSLSEARKIEFGNLGILKDTYFCNEGTSTWWIDMKPTIVKPGCSPAYMVNINTEAVRNKLEIREPYPKLPRARTQEYSYEKRPNKQHDSVIKVVKTHDCQHKQRIFRKSVSQYHTTGSLQNNLHAQD